LLMVLKLLMGFNQVTQVLTECRITEIIRHKTHTYYIDFYHIFQ